MANVFLSYASEDLALARTVHGWLFDDGHEIFEYLDPRNGVALGKQWEQQLRERLRWADAMVCVVTSAYVTSTWCTAEVGVAWSRGTLLLPIFAEPGVSHPVLASTHYADYTRDPEAARATVIEALRRVRRPWRSRLRRPGRRMLAGVVAGAAALGLGATGLILVPDHDTVDAATQRERDADPCPLLDISALEGRFGNVTPTYPQYLESCRATVASSSGYKTVVRVAFESALPLLDLLRDTEPERIERLGKIRLGEITMRKGKEVYPSDRRECTYRLWLAEDQPVIAFETRSYGEKNPSDPCQVSDTAARNAVTVLAQKGIPSKGNRTGNFTHAQSDACSLLDATDLRNVSGLDPDSAEPEWGRWRCAWSGNDGRTKVTLELLLEEPGLTEYDDSAGADGKDVQASCTPEECTVNVVHRTFPGQATEMLRLQVRTTPNPYPERLRILATDLARTAEKRLPD
ncbi:MAG: toll/interleukin-1 receptor domain-containing protein [Pseudonocardiaceae bacterium]